MKLSVAATIIVIGGFWTWQNSHQSPIADFGKNDTPIEALPVIEWFQVVAARDLGALEGLYSPRMRAQIEKIGWSKLADNVTEEMKAFHVSLEPKDYVYSFEGNTEHGAVKLLSRLGDRFSFQVVKIDDSWLVDEL